MKAAKIPAKYLFKVRDERAGNSELPLMSVSQYHGVLPRSELTDREGRADDLDKYKLCHAGDVVVNRMSAYQGALGLARESGLVSPDYLVLTPNAAVQPQYLTYLFKSRWFVGEMTARVRGIGSAGTGNVRTPRIGVDGLGRISVPMPRRSDQNAITDFLDRETDRIDALSDAKQRLIGLLAEKRTALITHAVTKGLDPTVPMKDSGISWIGAIPAHWEVVPLKYHADIQTGVTLGRRFDPQVQLVRRPYLRVANVQAGFADLDEIADVDVPNSEVGRYELRAGDVLMTEGGDIDKLGRGVVWEGQIDGCLHQNHVFAVRPDRRLNPHFLSLLLGTGHGRTYFELTAKKTTNLASTNTTKLKAFPVVLPDRSEQEVLVDLLSARNEQVDGAASALTHQLNLLAEYRQAVITAAVTGQLDEATLKGRKPTDEALGVGVSS